LQQRVAQTAPSEKAQEEINEANQKAQADQKLKNVLSVQAKFKTQDQLCEEQCLILGNVRFALKNFNFSEVSRKFRWHQKS
jgi:hypothetical protein